MLHFSFKSTVGLFASVCLSLTLLADDQPQNTLSITLPKPPTPVKVITINGSNLELTKPRGLSAPRGTRNHTREMTVVSPKHIKPTVLQKDIVVPVATKIPATPTVSTPIVKEPMKVEQPKIPVVLSPKETTPKEVVKIEPKKEVSKVLKTAPVLAKVVTKQKVAKAVVVTAPVVLDTGMAKLGRVSTYLRGAYISEQDAIKNLKDADFKILSSDKVDSKGELAVIVFTNDALLKYADKKERGFMASLRLLVDSKNKQISITNPLYFSRAFMQDEHDETLIKELIASINKAFTGLKISKDKLKYTLLPKYQFMFGMPYYEDMDDIAKADSSEKLLAKAKAHNGGKDVLFVQKISKDRILLGVKLPVSVASFIDKTGFENALLLPYPILLEDGEAKILAPKYYISIYYPMLKMSQFMKIATTPAQIEDACEKIFK